jgi:hypothetical protein
VWPQQDVVRDHDSFTISSSFGPDLCTPLGHTHIPLLSTGFVAG